MMKDIIAQAIACCCAITLNSCASTENSQSKIMTLEQCQDSDICIIEGIISFHYVDHVKMGKLTLPDDRCVNVSFDEKMIEKIETKKDKKILVKGRSLPGFADETLASLKVNGRRIGLSQCGDFYVFVE